MKKKIITLLLCGLTVLGGCGINPDTKQSAPTTSRQQEASVEQSAYRQNTATTVQTVQPVQNSTVSQTTDNTVQQTAPPAAYVCPNGNAQCVENGACINDGNCITGNGGNGVHHDEYYGGNDSYSTNSGHHSEGHRGGHR